MKITFDHRAKKKYKTSAIIGKARQLNNLPHPAKARAATGMTQRELAKAVGTHQAVVARFETRGQYPVNYLLRAVYLKVLGLTEQVAK